jgi:energy-coupling factor transport system substrate-specific component
MVSNISQAARKVAPHSNKWRVVDIVVASIIAVASGVIFWAWDLICTAPINLLAPIAPGFEGLLNGFWLFAGPLAAIIVRKPGAALYAEVLAAFLELTFGNQWGIGGSLIVGITQGLFAEIGFAIFAYKVWNVWSTLVSGAFAGIGCWIYYFFTNPGLGFLGQYGVIYLLTSVVSGALLAGVVMWFICKAIAATGVLDRFESGRVQVEV